jgi:hypothetical protein
MVNTMWTTLLLSATVSGGTTSTVPPTGLVSFYEDGTFIATGSLYPDGTYSTTQNASLPYGEPGASGAQFDLGYGHLEAVYSGDSVYQPSSSSESYQFTVSTEGADFLLAPQLPVLKVKAGGSISTGFNLSSLGGFNGAVSLSCSTSSSLVSCAISPTTVTVNGLATTTLTVSASPQAYTQAANRKMPARWPLALSGFVFALCFVRRIRKSARWLGVTIVLLALPIAGLTGCGAKIKYTPSSTQPIVPASTSYSVVVTGTANGVIHNAVITVEVH